jgi:hypothetical protein
METDRKLFGLSDEVIFQMVKLIQLGMLTHTNIADHFRTLRLEDIDKNSMLKLTPEYTEWFEEQLAKMEKEAVRQAAAERGMPQ